MMKRVLFSLIAGAALAGLPAPVFATAAAPSAASVYEVGRCIVRADRRAAISLMRTLPLDNSLADLSALGGSASGCAGGAAGVPAMLIRGAIAQELFIRDFRTFSREPRNPDRLVNLNLPVEAFAVPRSDSVGDLYRWSDCVVRNDTANTERLLHSPIGSPGESAAFAALQTYMSACFASGSQVAMRPAQVRSLFAQSAYNSMYRYWTGQLQSARNGVQP